MVPVSLLIIVHNAPEANIMKTPFYLTEKNCHVGGETVKILIH
jgi:hypothetical protein